MILVITHKTDYTADYVINKLNEREIPYKRLNCEDVLVDDFMLQFNEDFRYRVLGESDYTSVWFRRTKLPEMDSLPVHEQIYLLGEVDSFIKNLFTVIDAAWISEPQYVYHAENKLLQLKTAQQVGFTIPKTILTNSKKEVVSFYELCNQQIIIKPLAQTRVSEVENAGFIFTSRVGADMIADIDSYDLTPCIYQENIAKAYEVRVTVVGTKVFAASVDSQSDIETLIDWRKKKIEFKPIELPAEIEELCCSMVKSLNLRFGAIDLIVTPRGEYVFLEINPNGQWAWIEAETGLPISDAIIELLT